MRHIINCFNQNLTKIRKQAIELQQIQTLILNYIPEEIKAHCQIGSFNNGCLILTVNDAVWASQLRFILPEIRDNLRKDAKLYQLANIKININRELFSQAKHKEETKNTENSPWHKILQQLQSS